jgi:hypothetical protein
VLKFVLRWRSRRRSMLKYLFGDSVCIHHIRPRGLLEANLRVQLPARQRSVLSWFAYILFVNVNASWHVVIDIRSLPCEPVRFVSALFSFDICYVT